MQQSIGCKFSGCKFSSSQTRWLRLPVFVIGCLFFATACRAQSSLSKAQIEERLRYLATVDRFSASAPLSQEALMKLALEQRYWGAFPESYRGKGQRPGFDGYITRAMTRRFFKDLIGEDLRLWKGEEGDIQGDEMRWIYNTANTTHQRPTVKVTGRKDAGQSTVHATFEIFDYPKDSSGDTPTVKVATGAATLVHKGQIWTVTDWKVNRLTH